MITRLSLIYLFLLLLQSSFVFSQQIIGLWNFENGTQLPTIGNGTISLVGGVRAEWGRSGVQPGIALPEGREETIDLRTGTGFQTLNYPAQGTNPKTAGVQIRMNTTGYKHILLSADVRQGGTSANKLMLQYTVDGVTWEKAITYTTNDNDSWYLRNFNFKNIPGANNNPLFAIRFVTNFDDDIIGSQVYIPVSTSNVYSPAGSIRYDNIVLRAFPLNTPEDDRVSITTWNFDNQTFEPSEGTGTLSLQGGISYDNLWTRTGIIPNQTIADQGVYDYAALKTGFGLQTLNFPVSGSEKTAGIQLDVNSLNYRDLNLSADIRHGGTSANKLTLQYSVEQDNWKDAMTFSSNSGDTWFLRNFDFTGNYEVENQTQLRFRFVTSFDGPGYAASGFGKIYAPTGPIRFDNIRLSGRLKTNVNDHSFNSPKFTIIHNSLKFIEYSGAYKIFSISGIKLLEGKDQLQIDLSSLNKGVYLIYFNGETSKFIL